MQLLTPPGTAGVAVVRIAATEVASVLRCLRRGDGELWQRGAPGTLRRATLTLSGTAVDDVLVVERGQAGLELHLHGSSAVLQALSTHFALDTAAAEAPAAKLLREALAAEQVALAMEQLGFDFAAALPAIAALPPAARGAELAAARARSRTALAMVAAPRLVLMGAQNAGKSTLFNRLLFRERALAGPEPGLTRDAIRERTALAGYPYELVDTAGEGAAERRVDHQAIERGRDLRTGALRILVIDRARGPDANDRQLARTAHLVVANKSDLPAANWPAEVPCQLELAAASESPAAIRAVLGLQLRQLRRLPPAGPVGGFAALTPAQLAQLDS